MPPSNKAVDVIQWAMSAKVGDRVVYARRQLCGHSAHPAPAAQSAYKAHELGLVFLAQRNRGGSYDYEATRISAQTAKLLGIGHGAVR